MPSPHRLLFLCVLITAHAHASERFQGYSKKYQLDLQPGTPAFTAALNTFVANEQVVARLQQLQPAATFSLDDSPYSHLTYEEFSATRLPRMRRGERASSPSIDMPEAPSSFDWRKDGKVKAVTEVKDQGAMGSCWAFSAVGNVEGQRAISGAGLTDLSVEQLIECDGGSGPGQGGVVEGDCGVFGGWPYLAYQYWIKAGGVRTDKQMPYCAGVNYGQPGACLPCMVHGYNKTLCGNHNDLFCNVSTTLGQGKQGLCSSRQGTVATLSGYRRIPNNASAIAAELVATGPLSVALDATVAFQFYKRGVIDPGSIAILGGCPKNDNELNHGVLIVGYGVEGAKEYWTVKNSWGPKWGEDGYFRFARGSNKCGIESEVTTATVNEVSAVNK